MSRLVCIIYSEGYDDDAQFLLDVYTVMEKIYIYCFQTMMLIYKNAYFTEEESVATMTCFGVIDLNTV